MRLIDADKLYLRTGEMDAAPTVEAIPIEWLLKWTDTTESGKGWNDVGYQVIKAVINDWEKENE